MAEIITLGPVAYNPKGVYNSETSYEKLDVVLYQGVSYVAKDDVQGQLPTNTEYWDALGISGADLTDYYTKNDIDTRLATKYEKPETGIPKTDLSSTVQTSLGKADSAIQDISGKQDIIDSLHKLSSDLVDDTNKTNKFVTSSEKTTWNSKSDFSGSYPDLTNKPDLSVYEETTNKVISLSGSSTDTQYPSAKCVYDYIEEKIGDIGAILDSLDIGDGV